LKSFKRVIFSAPRQEISSETEDSEMTHSGSTGTQNRNSIDQARHCARATTAPSITWSAGKLRPTWSFIVVPRSQDGRTTVIRRSYDSFTSFTTVVRWWQDGRTTVIRRSYDSFTTVLRRSYRGRRTVVRRSSDDLTTVLLVLRQSYDSGKTVARWSYAGRTTVVRRSYDSFTTVLRQSYRGRRTVARRSYDETPVVSGDARTFTHCRPLAMLVLGGILKMHGAKKSESVNYIEFH